jgi:hypothetical protein
MNLTLWSDLPVWRFCPMQATASTSTRYAIKVIDSVETPYVNEKHRDGPLVVRTLVNSAQKIVGYTLTFTNSPKIREFGYSLAASYGVPDTEDLLLVMGSPHLRVLRAGTDKQVYHVVMRHK